MLIAHSNEIDSDSEQKQDGSGFTFRQSKRKNSKFGIITPECESFLKQCFKYDVKDRPYVEQLISHEFITKYIDAGFSETQSRFKTNLNYDSELRDSNFSRQIRPMRKVMNNYDGINGITGTQIKRLSTHASKLGSGSIFQPQNQSSLKETFSFRNFIKKSSINSLPGTSTAIGKNRIVETAKIQLPKLHLAQIQSEQELCDTRENNSKPSISKQANYDLIRKLNEEQYRMMADLLRDTTAQQNDRKNTQPDESPIIDRIAYGRYEQDAFAFNTGDSYAKNQNSGFDSMNPSNLISPTDANTTFKLRNTPLQIAATPVGTRNADIQGNDGIAAMEAEQARFMEDLLNGDRVIPEEDTSRVQADDNIEYLKAEQKKMMELLLVDVGGLSKREGDEHDNYENTRSRINNIEDLEEEHRKMMEDLMADVPGPAQINDDPPKAINIDPHSDISILEESMDNKTKPQQSFAKINDNMNDTHLNELITEPCKLKVASKTDLDVGYRVLPASKTQVKNNLGYTFRNEKGDLHQVGMSEDSSISEEGEKRNKQTLKYLNNKIQKKKIKNSLSQTPEVSFHAKAILDPNVSHRDIYKIMSSCNQSDDFIDEKQNMSLDKLSNPGSKIVSLIKKRSLLKKDLFKFGEKSSIKPTSNLSQPILKPRIPIGFSPSGSPLLNHTTGLTPMFSDEFSIKLKKPKQDFCGELYSSSNSSDNQ